MCLRIFVLLLFTSVHLSAQRVSEVCAPQKAKADSMMRARYGDTIFDKYLRFSSKHSYATCNEGREHKWRKKMRGDSIQNVHLVYQFVFPGSNPHFVTFYSMELDAKSNMTKSWPASSRRCINVTSETLDKFACDSLKLPLKKCNVSFYNFGGMYVDLTHYVNFDSTHIYLHVEYQEFRKLDRGQHFEIERWGFVVDACTGQYIGRTGYYYYGTKGAF